MRRTLSALIACLALAATASAQCAGGRCGVGSAYKVERTYATAYVAPMPVYGPSPQAYAPAYAGKTKVIVKERRGPRLFGRRR